MNCDGDSTCHRLGKKAPAESNGKDKFARKEVIVRAERYVRYDYPMDRQRVRFRDKQPNIEEVPFFNSLRLTNKLLYKEESISKLF